MPVWLAYLLAAVAITLAAVAAWQGFASLRADAPPASWQDVQSDLGVDSLLAELHARGLGTLEAREQEAAESWRGFAS